MAVVQPDVQSGKHPVLASVLMGILRALDDESTGKSSSSSEDNATCRLHDRGGPPCRILRHGKSSKVEVKKAEEYIIPPDEMLPKPDFLISDLIRTPPGSPQLHTIVETEEEGEDGDKEKKSSLEEKKVEKREKDAIKHLQKEEVKVCSSTSSPLVTSEDSDVAAFLSKHEYATLFGPNSGHSDKILIPSRFVQDYGETSSSVRIGHKFPLKRGSGEELQGNQVKKQKSDHKPGGSSLTASGVTGEDRNEANEIGSSVGSPSQRKHLKTSEEESEFSSEETLSDIMSDETVEESTASSVLDDRQERAPGRRKKKLTKTLKSLRIDSQDVDGILQKGVSTSLEDLSNVLSPDHQSSTVRSDGQGKTDTFTSSASQSTSASVSAGKSRQFSQSEETTDITREGANQEYISSANESKSAVEDVRHSESSYISGTTMSSELGTVLASSEKLSADSAQSSEPQTDLQKRLIGSNLTSATSKDDAIVTSVTSESSYVADLSEKVEVPSSDILTLSSSLSTASKSDTLSSKQSGIDPRDLPTTLRTGTQQPLISPLNDFYSSVMVSRASNTSSNASTHMQQSATTTPTESSEAHGDLRSQPSRSLEVSYYSSYYTETGGSAYSSSVTKSITTSRASRSEAESTTDVADDVPKHLTNVDLMEALLRSEPSPTDFEDSDTLTSSSDEFVTHGLMPDTFHSHERGFPETSSTTATAESIDIGHREVPIEPTGEKLDMIIDENRVQEIPWITEVQSGYLPVLLEESGESGDDIRTQVEVDKSDDSAFSELEERNIGDTSALQQQFSMTRVSESSTTNGDKPSSDDQAQRLLMIGIDGNETIFDDILITGDTSISSMDSEYLPIKEPDALSLISSERERYDDDFAVADRARDIVHYVTLNAVATVFIEMVVNAAITLLTDELDFSLQMEKALFPGIEEEDGDSPTHKHWIAPARYRQKRSVQSKSFPGKGYGGYEWEKSCKHQDRDEEEEAFLLCLERAFFPCLADSDDRDIGRPSSTPQSAYNLSSKVGLIAEVGKTDRKTKLCKSCQLVVMASHVSTAAVGTLSQIWNIMTQLWWMIWIYIRDNCKVSKVKRKDQSTQYDEDLATYRSQGGMVNGISDVRESSTSYPLLSRWEKSDELSLNIRASRIVASAVTGAVWGKEYAVSSSSYGRHEKSQPRGDALSTTPPNGRILATPKSDEDYSLRLSSSTIVGEVIANASFMNGSIRASSSSTPTELSNNSEDISLCSVTDNKVDSDSTGISACSLSDIPMSSITFMRQQLAEMRDIFQTHISEVEANAFSTPRPPISLCANVDNQKSSKPFPKLDESLTASSADCNNKMSEHVVKDLELSTSKKAESCKKDNVFESTTVVSALESRQGDTDLLDETSEVQNKINEPLLYLPRSRLNGEETDEREGDSNSTILSALGISDNPSSGISFIREQLANVKTLATSIMDDFDSYAEERSLLAKRSSQLTCGGVLVGSQSSCDSARTPDNKSSGSSSSLNLNREDTLDLDQDSKEDNRLVGKRKAHVVSQINGPLGWQNKNGNAKTHKDGRGAEDYAKNKDESDNLKCENTKEEGYMNETSKRQAGLVSKKQTYPGAKATKETVRESRQATGLDDQIRSLQMTGTQQTRQIATFHRNSTIRRHVIPRKKEAKYHHGKYSGESTCSTDHSSSIVSRPSSSFSDGSVSSGSKRVTIESESQGRGTTDVSCRISDRGLWVNTAFVNVIDDDHPGNTTMAADSGRSDAKSIKNKLMINVHMSPRNRKKHHLHRVRSGVIDAQLQPAPEDNQRALAILHRKSLEKKSQEMTENKISSHVHEEVIRRSNRSSSIYEISEEHKHGSMQLRNKLTPGKKSSSDSQCSTNQDHLMRECLSDGAVSENHQFLNRRQPSPKRKTRETKPQNYSCHFCAEKSDHPEDLLAAPVISRSERTKAVLSMLDDVADNLSLDTSAHDDSGRTHTMGKMGSFRKLFRSRKNKRRNGDKMPDHSPRVLSDSSVTESDGDSGSPGSSSDSSHTPRSSSAASLLSNVLRNLGVRRSKKKSKGTSSSTPKDRRSKKGSIAAFDEMLADLDDDCFIDDAFPSLVSVRDSASEDNTSLKEVLQDLIEEWSFDGLQEALDSSPKTIGEIIRGKLNQFMAEVRKGKRRAELLFARARTL